MAYLITLCDLYGGTNGTGGGDAWYCSRPGFGFLVPSSSEVLLRVAASEPPEAHVNGLEYFVHHSLVGDASVGGDVALNGRGGLGPAHFNDSVSEGYHGLGADENS